jgi:RHS repeat-associated protein
MKRKSLYFLSALLIIVFQAWCGNETRSSRVYANQLTTGAFIQCQDDKFDASNPSWASGFTNYENRAVVEFGLNEEIHKVNGLFKACVKFDMAVTDATLGVTTYTGQQLDIMYNPYEQTRYNDKSQLVFPGAYKVKVYNIRMTGCPSYSSTNCSLCTASLTAKDIYLQAEITTDRIYNFAYTDALGSGQLTHSVNAAAKEMQVFWDYVSGAETYELEYTYVDDYTATTYTSTYNYSYNSSTAYDFEHDATRIVTTANSYSIPLTYEKGYIVYRVRPVGWTSTKDRIEGSWYGAPASGNANSVSTYAEHLTTAFMTDAMNWQSVRTFAENGKTGIGVSFSDALGYNRQSIARLNTDGKTIAQSTLYDYYGRPTVNVLPAPVTGYSLEYRPELNMYKPTSTATAVYFDRSIFSTCTASNNICVAFGFSLDPVTSKGAANYYSPSNTLTTAFQGYLSDAQGLPYTQVKYKADGLSRVTNQSMPGPTHQLGSGKELQYFYAKPTQVELDRLFGSEAVRAEYAFKNVTIDPNGQLSETFLDKFGRTIATKLTGATPLNVDVISPAASTVMLTEYLHLDPTNTSDTTNRCKEVNTTYFLSGAANEDWLYYTTLGSFSVGCMGSMCFDCVYDMEIEIKDNCGNSVYSYTGSIGKQPLYTSVTCGSGPTSTVIAGSSFTTPVTINFTHAGEFSVYKKICVSQDPIDDYTNDFVDNNCSNAMCSILDSILAMSDFSSCYGDEDCAGCLASLSSYTNTAASSSVLTASGGNTTTVGGVTVYQYNTTAESPTMTPQQLSAALENCEFLCPPTGQCGKYTKALLADFYPYGQYADPVSTNTLTWPYSIFNGTNTLSGSPTWSTPPSPTNSYSNAANALDYVQLNNVNVDPKNLNKNDFIYYYRKSWANSFISKHPEYCKLYFYCNILSSTLDYDDAMDNISHFDTACYAGYLFPIPLAAYGSNTICAPSCTNSAVDPIIGLATAFPGFSTSIASFTNEITQNYNGSGTTIFQYVGAQHSSTMALGSDACVADLEWNDFRTFYKIKKALLYQTMMSTFTASPSSFGFSGSCGTVPTGFVSHFPNFQDSSSVPSITALATSTLANSTWSASFASSASTFTSNLQTSLTSTMTSQCAQSCESYTAAWNQVLFTSCPAYGSANSATQAAIIAGLIGVCEQGCDYNTNLLGASTTSPGLTFTLASTSHTVNSFQGVLDYYLGTNTCNAVILSQPGPYPATPVSNTPTLTSCKCDIILQNDADFTAMQTASTLPSGVTSAWQLFRKNNGYDLLEYNVLKCICAAATGYTWVVGHTWTTTELAAIAQNSFAINPKLECQSCMVCTNVVTAINSLTTQLPSSITYTNIIDAITLDSTNHVFAWASLDSQFGVHSFGDYIDLYEDCLSFTATSTFSNTITDQSLELFDYLSQLVKQKTLNTTARTMKLCTDADYFTSSMYTSTVNFPAVSQYTYNSATSPTNVLTFSVANTSTSNVLIVQLTFTNSYTGSWSSLKYLNEFKAYCPSPVAGANYTFVVNAVDNAFTVLTLTGTVLNQAVPICYLGGSPPMPELCSPKPKLKKNNCANAIINNALTQAALLAKQQLAQDIANFQTAYMDHCFEAIDETFTRTYVGSDGTSITLYYYDQAGNLQRTVPPKGATPIATVTVPIPLTSTVYPAHGNTLAVDLNYVNNYNFSSYNQPNAEKTIDGGQTKFIYDESGRIVLSQNAKQAAASSSVTGYIYSYTNYDDHGRIIEVGELTKNVPPLASTVAPVATTYTDVSYIDFAITFQGLLNSSATTFSQVTKTYYDAIPSSASADAVTYFGLSQNTLNNLRERVACVTFADDPGPSNTGYDFATYYSYDDHGNVEMLHYENNLMSPGVAGYTTATNNAYKEMKFKKVQYTYDLISGNMLQATYQPGMIDMLMHKYEYDADNRLHETFTSKDNINWDRDVKYFYYEHGPLARVERADKQVQGMDYIYTIHGWIKGINSDAMAINTDAGKDGAFTNAYMSSYNTVHGYFARDAMAYSLNYYNSGTNKDYTAIKAANFNANDMNPQASLANMYNTSAPLYLDNNGAGHGPSLYNGNISSMITSFINKNPGNIFALNKPFPQLTAYRYDQLHRIMAQRSYRDILNNAWTTPVTTTYDDTYKMELTYDKNGNIGTLLRNGTSSLVVSGANMSMDDLNYTYFEGSLVSNSYNSNKLACVQDAVSGANYSTDIDTYASCTFTNTRYEYDDIGNLIKDKGEYIDNIEWTVDRKVKTITRDATAMLSASVTLSDIEYQYNGMRQRVVKIVKPRNVTTKALESSDKWIYTFYVYDASGNAMAVYSQTTYSIGGGYMQKLELDENHVYGNSRLAIARPSNTLATWMGSFAVNSATSVVYHTPTVPVTTTTYNTKRMLGYKEFELTNHLGNVIATVSDRKIVFGQCVPDYLVTFNTGTIAPFAVISGTATVASSMMVVSTASNSSSNVSAAFTLNPGNNYQISLNLNVSSSPSNTLMAVLFPYNNAFGTFRGDSTVYYFNASTVYNIDYSTPIGTTYNDVYFSLRAINNNTAVSTYSVHSLTFTDMGSPGDVNPCALTTPTLAGYFPDLLMHTDYYAFGQEMPGRTWTFSDYRYAMMGKEKLDEWQGTGNAYDFGARINDPRIGRWLARDPKYHQYPSFSPYVAFGNDPNIFIDPGGETLRVAAGVDREKVRATLQKLTNDKVVIQKNGVVTLVTAKMNPGKKLTNGTQLIRDVANHQKTTEIIIFGEGENSGANPDGHYMDSPNAHNGKGENMFIVIGKESEVLVRDKKTGKTFMQKSGKHIDVADELIHSLKGMNGEQRNSDWVEGHDYKGADGKEKHETQTREELETHGLGGATNYSKKTKKAYVNENDIRKEQGMNQREAYSEKFNKQADGTVVPAEKK